MVVASMRMGLSPAGDCTHGQARARARSGLGRRSSPASPLHCDACQHAWRAAARGAAGTAALALARAASAAATTVWPAPSSTASAATTSVGPALRSDPLRDELRVRRLLQRLHLLEDEGSGLR